MNIYLEVENFYKEFPGKLLLALEAARNDFNVFIGHRHDIQQAALKDHIGPGIIHLKDANSLKENVLILSRLKKKGFVFTCQDEEPGITIDNYKLFINTRFRDAKSFKYIKYYFNYGKRDLKLFKKWKLDKYGTKFVLTGSPKFDILQKELNNKEKKKFINRLNFKRKYILITTSIGFPLSIRRFADSLFLRTFNLKNKFLKNNITETYFNLVNQSILNLKDSINLINFLIKNLRNYSIVIKIHPDEVLTDWKKILEKNKNLYILKNYFAQTLINNSELLIQNGSTTAIEAILANNDLASVYSRKFKFKINKNFPNSFSNNFETKEALLKYIKKGLNKNNTINKNKKKLEYFIENIYEKKSYIQIVKSWKKIKISYQNSTGFKKNYNLVRNLKSLIKNTIGLQTPEILDIMKHKYPNVDNKIINDLKEDLIKINPEFKKINIKVLSDRIIKISKK